MSLPNRSLRMTRRFDVTPERVFDAWVDPRLTRLWLFTSAQSEDNEVEIDGRVGGKWRISDTRDGTRYTAEGEYFEFDRPRRLVFSFAMLQFSPNSDTIAIDLAPDGTGTLMIFTQSGTDITAELAAVPEGGQGDTEHGWSLMFLALGEVTRGRVPIVPKVGH